MNAPERSRRFAVAALLFEGGLVVLALLIGGLLQRNPLPGIGGEADGWSDLLAVAWGVAATLPMLAGLLLIERFPFGPLRSLQQTVQDQLVPLIRHWTIPQMATISLAAGLGEEMLFRGLLQTGLADFWNGTHGVVLAVLLASLAFGVCHWLTPTYAVLAAAVGAYLGLLLILFDNLLVPVVAHALYDFIALIHLARTPEEPPAAEVGED